MAEHDNWRQEINAADFFSGQKKRQAIESRRPVIKQASDLVGPGIDKQAIRITNFNDLLATFNGYYSASGDAYFSPDGDELSQWVGVVVSDAEWGGYQEFTRLNDGVVMKRVFKRAPYAPESISWEPWA
jgi:hypothetical protein